MRAWTRWHWVWLISLALWLIGTSPSQAGEISDRLAQFPDWQTKPTVQAAEGDLIYPDWFAGEWLATTTLVDLVAPVPELTTPGFEGNRQYLNQPVPFRVRFVDGRSLYPPPDPLLPIPSVLPQPGQQIVSDRAFNGLSLAKAYLGEGAVVSVKVDPTNPNRQITLLQGNRQLVSTIAARAIETPDPDDFLTTEVFLQEFRGSPQIFFNQVETTTAYHRSRGNDPAIVADQVTAIYLSPQDPDFFKAGDRPVALYRYRMEFSPIGD
ncbi:hypothetical protein H6G89_10990 [Oscillatoria sp. FACHB-1407]|uniref:DUF6816 family protein n=1 Tax=Oscillatoria sp. FACHB-1407 TaxID=2692847 RepID=UPI001686A4BA|nr:hypothetical protein [Oscillatoria sp. FACHB-1407]MBD2461575.1 hypothetical protein [Oscillatoria sp. FACHB-1407]